jgi:hypothetical protein
MLFFINVVRDVVVVTGGADAMSNDAAIPLDLFKHLPSNKSKCEAKMFFSSMLLKMRSCKQRNLETQWV